jgi:hypothetical protein
MKVRCVAHSAWHSGGRINHDEVAEVSEEDALALIENGLVMEITERQLEIEAKATRRKPKDPSYGN